MQAHRPKRYEIDINKLCAIRDYFLRLPNQVALFSPEERENSLVIGLWACDSEGVDDPITALSRVIRRHAKFDLAL